MQRNETHLILDFFNILSSYISYIDGLKNFSVTSKYYHDLIKQSSAGKLANHAYKLQCQLKDIQPYKINCLFADNQVLEFGAIFTTVLCITAAVGGFGAHCYMKIYDVRDIEREIKYAINLGSVTSAFASLGSVAGVPFAFFGCDKNRAYVKQARSNIQNKKHGLHAVKLALSDPLPFDEANAYLKMLSYNLD